MTISVEKVGADARVEVECFYLCELRREVTLAPEQQVFAARENGVVVGALRLCPEADTLLLRTVVVAEGLRGRGIGRVMLEAASAAIGARECWCFPWEHLEGFYGRIGFRRTSRGDVPSLLEHRLAEGCIPTRREAAR